MNTTKIRNQNGVTLLEVLIAMLILSFALLMLLNMAMVALDGNDWSNKTTLATQLLQEKLEEIRGSGNFTNGSDTAQGVVRSWTVSNAGSHLRRVDVSVVWQNMQSLSQTNSLTAYVRTEGV